MSDHLCSELWRPLLKYFGALPYNKGIKKAEEVWQKVSERSGELGRVICEGSLRTLGLSVLEKGRQWRQWGNMAPLQWGAIRRSSQALLRCAWCCNKEILMDKWGKKQITLDYVSRENIIISWLISLQLLDRLAATNIAAPSVTHPYSWLLPTGRK